MTAVRFVIINLMDFLFNEQIRGGCMDNILYDRIKGGLYGVAVGDALGGTTEFMSVKEIKEKHGYLTEIIGGGCGAGTG